MSAKTLNYIFVVMFVILLGSCSYYVISNKNTYKQTPVTVAQDNEKQITTTQVTHLYELKANISDPLPTNQFNSLIEIDTKTGVKTVKYANLEKKMGIKEGRIIERMRYDPWRQVYYLTEVVNASDTGIQAMYEYNPQNDQFSKLAFNTIVGYESFTLSPLGKYAVSISPDGKQINLINLETRTVTILSKLTKPNETYLKWQATSVGYELSWQGSSKIYASVFDSTKKSDLAEEENQLIRRDEIEVK